jgi:hypothetical protein
MLNIRRPEFEIEYLFTKSAMLLISRSKVITTIDTITMQKINRFIEYGFIKIFFIEYA